MPQSAKAYEAQLLTCPWPRVKEIKINTIEDDLISVLPVVEEFIRHSLAPGGLVNNEIRQ